MKFAKAILMFCLLLLVLTACQRRAGNTVASEPPAVNSLPEAVSRIENGVNDFGEDVSEEENGIFENSEYEEGFYPEESSLYEEGDDRFASEDESAAPTMSTDFKEIGALSAELVEWGSGGPTDDTGRPNGCALYQQKYGKYDAYFITPQSNKVYLTFDEGYENGYTAAILDTLKEKGAKAVFFITYPYAKENPELVTRMVQEGHVLGSHSTKHKAFPTMTLEEAMEDVQTLHDYVKANFGYEMSLFRFPEGKFSEQTLALLQSMGYKSLFWSFAYVDYLVDNQPLTIEALDKITSKCHPGALYLLHAVSKSNAEVLGEAIDSMREKGYTLAKWDIY